jgi:acetyl-CoA C-acetyltransferase
MRNISVVGIGQIPVLKSYDISLREMGTKAVRLAMESAGVEKVDALFLGNMLSDELQGQKHLAALVADEVGLYGIEALQVRAATASGAAALRMATLAVSSGEIDRAVVVGVEKMSVKSMVTPTLAKALDANSEIPVGANMINTNAQMMKDYFERFDLDDDSLVNFGVNAHRNSRNNEYALFDNRVTARTVKKSKILYSPMRLMDSSPICDGAAAVVVVPTEEARAYSKTPIHLLASTVATDRFRVKDRKDPLLLRAAKLSAEKAFRIANVNIKDISFFELHDAFSIMACLLLEACGFAEQGEGWRLAEDKEIFRNGSIPVATMGGLKGRGHPIGATALYQVCEIVLQLTEQAGKNQIKKPKIGLLQSVGGAATTLITHIFGN